ncbi:MAG TPA: IPT/TIG domain-containing protein, partial [Polyangia bacterium]|nr:IPT/TIG domain-containing protein [Polyangia bacterium]
GGAACGGKTTKFASTPRAWLDIGGVLKPLTNVAFNSAGSITGTVPMGQTVGGPYDLIVQNPDGSVGLLATAFKVVDMPVPQVTSIDPASVPTNFSGTIKIFGSNFRAPIKVEYYAQGGTPTTVTSTLVSATEVDFTYPALAQGAYVLRVTDTDEGTYGEFSALAVINSSLNIVGWTDVTATPLPNPTMRHGAAGGQVSTAARYLYVVGGDGGGATPTRYDTTQMASVDKYGNVGTWFIAHNKLATARTRLQLIDVPSSTGAGGYLYAVGGEAASGAVATVSRAKILLPSEAPQLSGTKVSLGGMLARGTWYYRVSAVLDGTDVANPLGETLTSQEAAAHTVDGSKVTLTWSAVPKAASYRVYRTAMVNGTSQTEVLLADSVSMTTFVDDGTTAPGTATPLAQGELGVWVDVAALNTPRRSLGLAMAHDPTGNAYLYAVGGDKAASGTPATADLLDTYEYANLGSDGLTLAAWTQDATHKLVVPRTMLQSPVGEHATSPSVVAPASYVYAVGGYTGGTPLAVQDNYESATVAADGSLTWAAGLTSNKIHAGLSSIIVADQMFMLGGIDALPMGDAAKAQYATPPAFANNFSTDPASIHDLGGAENIAALTGFIWQSAHFYLLGGTTDGTAALNRVWSQVY